MPAVGLPRTAPQRTFMFIYWRPALASYHSRSWIGNPRPGTIRVAVLTPAAVTSSSTKIERAAMQIADLWQANAAGRYRHPHDSNEAPLDPNFQGWAIVPSGKEGKFRFRTVSPGAYPASDQWTSPPHIHFKVSKKGFIELITQMYFPGHRLNESDLLLKRKSKEERKLMIATKAGDRPDVYAYKIVLQKA